MSIEKEQQTENGLTPSTEQTKAITPTVEKNTSSSRAPASSSAQKQLLVLAKQFALDGAMVPENKQMPIEDRASRRERIGHLRKQNNLEAIIQKSLGYCSTGSASMKADPDWFNQFTVLAEDISNNTMQDLWAKILAGEVTNPGSFSLKSLNVFKSMSITDAKLLAKVCGLAFKDSSKKNVRIISGGFNTPGLFSIFSKNTQPRVNLNLCGLSYTELLNLADNNLIFMQEAESNLLQQGEEMVFNFNGKNIKFKAKKNQCGLSFYKFTPIGSELALLISDNPNKDLLPLLTSSLQSHFSVN